MTTTTAIRVSLRAIGVSLLLAASGLSAFTLQQAPGKPSNVEIATFPSEWTYRPGQMAQSAPNGMVASNCALATEAGVEILKAGGSASDAAVAVGFALAVAYPEAGNLGGGGYAVLQLANGRRATLDYREIAPASRDTPRSISLSG